MAAFQKPEQSQGLQHSVVPSGLEAQTQPPSQGLRRHGLADFTVPIPIGPR